MRKNRNNFGFSLTEVLLALGTLSIGMIFVAGVFPVAIYFSTQATEQTIAAVVADEAFAKIRLCGESDPGYQNWLAQPPVAGCVDFNDVVAINPDEFAYPSDFTVDVLQRRYWWSALCRRLGDTRLVQVTVFVSRKISASTTYPDPAAPIGGQVSYPMPVKVGVVELVGGDVLRIDDTMKTFINDGYTIARDQTGQLYRVLERRPSEDDTIVLDRDWIGAATDAVWVVRKNSAYIDG